MMQKYDAVIVGSGPNGLAAAIYLQQKGLSTLLVEGKETVGGGLRTLELTLPGFKHDMCSAIHPMAAASPFFKSLPLYDHGLEFIDSPVLAAHPFEDGTAIGLFKSLEKTKENLGEDGERYVRLLEPFISRWNDLVPDFMGPLRIPENPVLMAKFGLKALQSASALGNKTFVSVKNKGFWAGMAAHSIQPLENLATSAIGLVLLAAGHTEGWPIPKGGSQSIANALLSYYHSIGGKFQAGKFVKSLNDIPPHKAVLFDLTPKQILEIAGGKFSGLYLKQLKSYRYGMGVCKVDWALSGQIPFQSEIAKNAGTVHLGGTFSEIANSEAIASKGGKTLSPFVLLAQQSLFDETRAPEGKHTAWAYCHVPHGSDVDYTAIIENQIEKYAPGFKDLILAKHTHTAKQMEQYNPNYIGGDINGGIIDLRQLYTRPALKYSPYRTSLKGMYICSSSTPPGGGVHGMCGYFAAKRAYKDIFKG